MLTYFPVIQGQIAEIGALKKMLITPEWKKLGRSALSTWKENNFLYRMIKSQIKIQRKILLEYRL